MANTAGMRQSVHKDSAFEHPGCPYYFIANIPLCDFSVENGSTEFWLGSSVYTTIKDQQTVQEDRVVSGKQYKAGERIPWISPDATEARRAVRPPIQPEARRGDIMIRDLRTWHAGMPNSSDRHRIMLGLGYQVGAAQNTIPEQVGCADNELHLSRALFIRITDSDFTSLSQSRISS